MRHGKKRASQLLSKVYFLVMVSNLGFWRPAFAATETSAYLYRMVL